MEDSLCILLIILMVWLIIYLILEFNLINSRRIIVKKAFIELDEMLIKRLNILSKMLDVVKAYDKKQFDDFGSRLYDYIKQYDDYDYNKKIRLDKLLNNDIKRILLVSKVYPEVNEVVKYTKMERQLIRYDKVIRKLKIKYNKTLDAYNNRKKIFPSGLVCKILNFYNFEYCDLKM